VYSNNPSTVKELTQYICDTITSGQWAQTSVKQSVQDICGFFKSRREIWWASTVMVSSSKQPVYFKKCIHLYSKQHISHQSKLLSWELTAKVLTNRPMIQESGNLSFVEDIRDAIQKFLKYINKNYYILPGSYSAPSPSK
jgi:hypothetical protein